MTDINTYIVSSHNETLNFCKRVSSYNEFNVYRANTELVSYRNYYLHRLMNNQ